MNNKSSFRTSLYLRLSDEDKKILGNIDKK